MIMWTESQGATNIGGRDTSLRVIMHAVSRDEDVDSSVESTQVRDGPWGRRITRMCVIRMDKG